MLPRVSTLLIKEGIKQSVETCDDEEKIDLVVDCVNKILGRVVCYSSFEFQSS